MRVVYGCPSRRVVLRRAHAERKHLVTDAIQGVEPAVSLVHAAARDLLVQLPDHIELLPDLVQLLAQFLLCLGSSLLTENVVSKPREPPRHQSGEEYRDAERLAKLAEVREGRAAVDQQRRLLVREPPRVTGSAGQPD